MKISADKKQTRNSFRSCNIFSLKEQTNKGAIFSVFYQNMDCKITIIIVENWQRPKMGGSKIRYF